MMAAAVAAASSVKTSEFKALQRTGEVLHSPAVEFATEAERVNEIPDLFLRDSEEEKDGQLPSSYRLRVTNGKDRDIIPLRSLKETEIPRSICRIPRAYAVDIALPKQVKQLNGGLDWYTALCGGFSFFAPFPQELYGLSIPGWQSDYTIDLTFDLSANQVKAADKLPCTHSALMKHVKKTGPLELTITKERLVEALGKVIDFGRTDYHCLPLCIKVKRIQSNLPIPLSCQLQSRVSPSSSNESKVTRVNWVQSVHIANTQDANEPGFLVPANTTVDYAKEPVIYMPSSTLLNHPCFSRWITVDFNALQNTLNQMVTEDRRYYSIKAPPTSETMFDLPFWFFMEHYPSINHLTQKRKAIYQFKENVNQCIVSSHDNNTYVHTPKEIFDELLNRRKTLFNKDRLLMHLDDLTLQVKPLHGEAGWIEYSAIQQLRHNQGMLTDDAVFARFSVTISLCFEPYSLKKGSTEARSIEAPMNPVPMYHPQQRFIPTPIYQHREAAAIEQFERRFKASASMPGGSMTSNDFSFIRIPPTSGSGTAK